jgi:hypothetical protein
VIDTVGNDQGRPPLHTMNDVVLGEKEFGEQGAVLTGDPGD